MQTCTPHNYLCVFALAEHNLDYLALQVTENLKMFDFINFKKLFTKVLQPTPGVTKLSEVKIK